MVEEEDGKGNEERRTELKQTRQMLDSETVQAPAFLLFLLLLLLLFCFTSSQLTASCRFSSALRSEPVRCHMASKQVQADDKARP